jgi:hypothetical protein
MRRNVVFTALLMGTTVGLLVLATGLTPLGRLAPLWVLLPTSALVALQLSRDLRANPATDARRPASAETRRRQLRITVWLVGLTAAVFLIGFLPAAAVFVFLFLRAEAGTRAPRAAATAVGTVVLLYLVFGVAGGIALPEGVLF